MASSNSTNEKPLGLGCSLRLAAFPDPVSPLLPCSPPTLSVPLGCSAPPLACQVADHPAAGITMPLLALSPPQLSFSVLDSSGYSLAVANPYQNPITFLTWGPGTTRQSASGLEQFTVVSNVPGHWTVSWNTTLLACGCVPGRLASTGAVSPCSCPCWLFSRAPCTRGGGLVGCFGLLPRTTTSRVHGSCLPASGAPRSPPGGALCLGASFATNFAGEGREGDGRFPSTFPGGRARGAWDGARPETSSAGGASHSKYSKLAWPAETFSCVS